MRRTCCNRAWQSLVTLVLATWWSSSASARFPATRPSPWPGEDRTPEALAAIRQQYGLDQPLPVQYLALRRQRAAQGDLGRVDPHRTAGRADARRPRPAGDPGALRCSPLRSRWSSGWAPGWSRRCGGDGRPSGWPTASPCSGCRCRTSGSGSSRSSTCRWRPGCSPPPASCRSWRPRGQPAPHRPAGRHPRHRPGGRHHAPDPFGHAGRALHRLRAHCGGEGARPQPSSVGTPCATA